MLLLFPLIVFGIQILPDNVKGAEKDVFVQTGKDLLLNVTILKKFDLFYWQFNSKTLVAFNSSGKRTVEKNYTGRIEFFGDERSVNLKNLQKSDSGVYSAWGVGDRRELLEKYNVTVKGSANQSVAVAVLALVMFPCLGVGVAVTATGFAVWCCKKKCKSSATSQDQKGPVRFSAGSGSISPSIHIPFAPVFNKGADRLISEDEDEENSAD